MKYWAILRLTLYIAFRNLWLYRLKTVVIAGLLGFWAFLLILGMSVLQDIQKSMRESITGSITGDVQIYSNQAKDDLAIFGASFMGRSDIGSIDDFLPVQKAVLEHPNVKAFVPMGIDMAILARGNELDDTIDTLRDAYKNGDQDLIHERIQEVKFRIEQLENEIKERRKFSADSEELNKQEADLAVARAPGYLDSMKTADEGKLQFLETHIAPISGEKQPLYLRYVGTDVQAFLQHFNKAKVTEGRAPGPGERGVLVGHKFRELYLKNLVARQLDRLKKRIETEGIAIKGDAENERTVADLQKQYERIVSYLNRHEAEDLSHKLTERGIKRPEKESDFIAGLVAQLKEFLTVTDENFAERYKWFYDHIAPMIKLYEISPGETIIVRSYTKSGYMKALAVKVLGIYSFAGLEDSDIAGAVNIIDLVSFRELYGQMTAESQKELQKIREAVGYKDIHKDNIEAELFGGNRSGTTAEAGQQMEVKAEPIKVERKVTDHFDPEEIKQGLALNAAVILNDPGQVQTTIQQLKDILKGKSLDLRVIDWQAASGIVGQFVNIVGIVLVLTLIVVFIVALVIINNSIVVGIFGRFREIGTMRAMGAQKGFVMSLFLAETAITSFLGAVIGTLGALLVLNLMGKHGFPAKNDVLAFLFSGPRLYPKFHWAIVWLGPLIVTVLATVASLYAARYAARVKPTEAMAEKE